MMRDMPVPFGLQGEASFVRYDAYAFYTTIYTTIHRDSNVEEIRCAASENWNKATT